MQIKKGLATWAGLVAAVGQYALAIATFMNTFDDVDPTAGLGALATATATLYGVIKGRMDQATAAIQNPTPAASTTLLPAVGYAGTQVTSTWTQPRPGAETRTADPGAEDEPGDPDALPDYETAEHPPDDEGDEHARPETGQ